MYVFDLNFFISYYLGWVIFFFLQLLFSWLPRTVKLVWPALMILKIWYPVFFLRRLLVNSVFVHELFFFNGNYWFSIAADFLFFRFAVNLFTRNWYPILFVLTLVRYFLFPSFSLSLFSYKRIDLFFIDLFKNLSVQSGLRSLVLAGARYLANFTLNTRFVTRDFPKFLTFYSRWGFYLQGHVMSFEPQIVMVRYPKVLFRRLLATFVFELTLFCIVIFPIS